MAPALLVNNLGMWQGTALTTITIEEALSSGEVALGAEEILEENLTVKRRTDLLMPCA